MVDFPLLCLMTPEGNMAGSELTVSIFIRLWWMEGRWWFTFSI